MQHILCSSFVCTTSVCGIAHTSLILASHLLVSLSSFLHPPIPFVPRLVISFLDLLSLPGLRLFPPSPPLPHPSLLLTPSVVFDSSKAGNRRANSRWTHSNTQLCHLLRSHDWAANPLEHHDAPSYLTHRSIMTKEQDGERERRNSQNEKKS